MGRVRRRLTLGVLVGLAAIGVGVAQSRSDELPRAGVHAPCNAPASAIAWIRVAPPNETAGLDRWCAGVGPPLVRNVPAAIPTTPDLPVLVSWNTHEGGGDIDALVADLKGGRLTGHPVTSFVLLLQEVYRSSPDVPARAPAMPAWAAAELSRSPNGTRDDIGVVAGRLTLAAYYVPSMRNGEPGVTTEDRGNAILSTLPLSDLRAIELPLERQRRVALQATVTVKGPDGAPLPLHVVCTHFTNMVMHHLWVLSESGRLRQARALSKVLPAEGALVVAGDFNAWFGGRDGAVRELARIVPHVTSEDRRATFGPLRLDHVLARLPDGWRTTVRRAGSRYGSDHYPLITIIETR